MKRSQARSEDAIEFARTQWAEANEFAWAAWQWLRNRRCFDQKFRREYPIPPYTADFCCVELKLVIEIDGEGHLPRDAIARDRQRDRFLKRLGFRVLRIPGYEVIREDSEAYAKIERFISEALNELK